MQGDQKNTAMGCGLMLVVGIAAAFFLNGSDPASDRTSPENTKQGFHCLSGWDGANRSLVAQVEASLRNPSSFEHVETKIGPVNGSGKRPIIMQYRAQNGFGGLNVETATGTVDPRSCEATLINLSS